MSQFSHSDLPFKSELLIDSHNLNPKDNLVPFFLLIMTQPIPLSHLMIVFIWVKKYNWAQDLLKKNYDLYLWKNILIVTSYNLRLKIIAC